jgi:hypothetical protein
MRAFYGKFRSEYCEYTENKSKKISHSGKKCLSPCRLFYCEKYGERPPNEDRDMSHWLSRSYD